jgi:DNA-binding Lrp family transcriptional regulator
MSFEAVSYVLRGRDGRCVEVRGDGKHVGKHAVFTVLIVLAEHSDPWGRGACPSQRTIADETGLDRRQVQHALRQLEADQIITQIAPAVPRQRGTTYNIRLGGDTPAQSSSRLGGDTPAQSYPNSAGVSAGVSAGIPPHEPEPEHCMKKRDSYASDDEPRLTVEQIRELRTAKVDEGRHQLDDERLAQKTKNSRTSVA